MRLEKPEKVTPDRRYYVLAPDMHTYRDAILRLGLSPRQFHFLPKNSGFMHGLQFGKMLLIENWWVHEFAFDFIETAKRRGFEFEYTVDRDGFCMKVENLPAEIIHSTQRRNYCQSLYLAHRSGFILKFDGLIDRVDPTFEHPIIY